MSVRVSRLGLGLLSVRLRVLIYSLAIWAVVQQLHIWLVANASGIESRQNVHFSMSCHGGRDIVRVTPPERTKQV